MKYDRVLLICIDALSKKYQSFFDGYFNVVYRNYAVTHTWTLPAHAAMLAGVNITELFHVFDTKRLDRWKDCVHGIPTLATSFRTRGFTTRAITSGGYLCRYFGWGHDWDEWQTSEDGYCEWNGEKIVPKKKELLFLHTYYVHNWFNKTRELFNWFKTNGERFNKKKRYDVSLMDKAQKEYKRRVKVLAHRLSWIKMLPDDILVVFTADHGEIFSVDGKHFHHGDMAQNHSDVYKVPLLLRTKGLRRRQATVHMKDMSLRAMIENEAFGV